MSRFVYLTYIVNNTGSYILFRRHQSGNGYTECVKSDSKNQNMTEKRKSQ